MPAHGGNNSHPSPADATGGGPGYAQRPPVDAMAAAMASAAGHYPTAKKGRWW